MRRFYPVKRLLLTSMLVGSCQLAFSQNFVYREGLALGGPKEKESSSGSLVVKNERAPVNSKRSVSDLKQELGITGKVVDENGDGLPGVTIVLKGTARGVSTNIDGNFVLTVPDGTGTLVVSFVGYQKQEIPIRNRSTINVVLAPDAKALEEVVVVGYGEIKKSDLTGAVVSVSNEDIVKRGTTSPLAALQGQVAGVNITANTGLPGSDFNINIRGVNSLTGGNPLFVVDGVMTDNINFLNPMDIERIDVLKDASSTAIYGSRGSNGVVIVTTKSGAGLAGRTGVQYSGFTGLRMVSNMPDFLNAEEAVLYTMNRGIVANLVAGRPVSAPDNLYGFPSSGAAHEYWMKHLGNKNYYDWLGEQMKTSIQTNHFVSGSGGNDKLNFTIGAGYQGDNGNIEGQTFKKYNFKGNVNANISEQWSMGTNINLAHTDRELRSGTAMRQLFRMPPYAPAFDENGELIRQPMMGISGNVSPLAQLKYDKFNTQQYYLISNFHLQFKPIEGISLRSTFSPNMRFQRAGEYWDRLSTGNTNRAQMSTSQDFSYIWDNQLRVSKEINEHRFDYDFIHSMLMNRFESLYGYGNGLPFNSEYFNLGSAPQNTFNLRSNYRKSTLMSYTNRLNYSFKDRYMLTATARWDGSSRLAPGHKWAFFPSVGMAWIASEEAFLRNVSSISNLKFRLSFGYTGNDNIDPYETQFAVNRQTYYDWNGTLANGFRPNAMANKALTWERTREWNLGVDFGLLNNRIAGEVNVYDKMSLNLLMERKLAVPTGWASMMDNVGSVSNRGVELQLRTINVRNGDFTWETNFTFSANRNKIVELYGKKEDDVANRWFIGQPVNVVYGMVFDGIWQKNEVPEGDLTLEGTAKVKDLNNDGVIDIDHDMTILGSPMPSWVGGFSSTFTYKNFDFTANLYTNQGVFIFSPFHREFTDLNSKQILDVPYYMRDNPVTESRYSNTYPQPRNQGQYWGEDAEDYGYPGFNKDASFVRLQNLTLGYNFGPALLKKLGLQGVRLYVNALNPYVWTNYEGFDPEWGGAGLSGSDANSSSFSIYQFGTNISF